MEDRMLKSTTDNVMEAQARDNFMGLVIAFLAYGWSGAMDWHNEEEDQVTHVLFKELQEKLDAEFAVDVSEEDKMSYLDLTEKMAKFKEILRNALQEMES